MEKKKETWTEPKLTALVRRKPEEGILWQCKDDSVGSSGPGGANERCYGGHECPKCNEHAGS